MRPAAALSRIAALAAASALGLSAAAQAHHAEDDGAAHAAPAEGLVIAGEATRSMFWTDIYVLTVFDEDGALQLGELRAPERPLKVTLEVLYDGDLPDIPDSWSEEIKPALSGPEWRDLRRAYGNLDQGDVITMAFEPNTGTTIARNGTTVIDKPGALLAAATLDVWFGETPVSADMKETLLNG